MIQIQGYALPWDKPAYVDGLTETVAPRAVAADSPRNITVVFGDHETDGRCVYAQTKDRSLTFFQDDYGLGFHAYLGDAPADYAVARAVASGSVSRCSVNFMNMSRQGDGRVVWAAIDHVALVAEGAYADTGCWLASQPVNDLPRHLRDIRMTFMNSVIENSRRRKTVGGGLQSSPAARAVAAKPNNRRRVTVPASLYALLNDAETMATLNRMGKDYADLMRKQNTQHARG